MKKATALFLSVLMIVLLGGCVIRHGSDPAAPSAIQTEKATEAPAAAVTEAATEPVVEAAARTEKYSLIKGNERSFGSYTFSDGVAWAPLKNNATDKKISAVVNTAGEILYLLDAARFNGDGIVSTRFTNGYSVAYGVKGTYILPGVVVVDSTGKEVYADLDENTYFWFQPEDGRIFIIKKETGFEKVAWHVYTFDENMKLYDTGIETKENEISAHEDYALVTDGIYYGNQNILNMNQKIFYSIRNADNRYFSSWKENYGYARVDKNYLFDLSIINNAHNRDEFFELIKNSGTPITDQFCPEGATLSELELRSLERGVCFYRKYDVKDSNFHNHFYRDYVDLNGNQLFAFPEFPDSTSYRSIEEFSGGYCIIFLTGADKEVYITAIDEEGKLQYDPLCLEPYGISVYTDTKDCCFAHNGYLFIRDDQDKENVTIRIIDPKGNCLSLSDNLSGLNDTFCTYDEIYLELAIGDDYILASETRRDDDIKYHAIEGAATLDSFTASYNSQNELITTGKN